jgi:hypothetical protein
MFKRWFFQSFPTTIKYKSSFQGSGSHLFIPPQIAFGAVTVRAFSAFSERGKDMNEVVSSKNLENYDPSNTKARFIQTTMQSLINTRFPY